jgi:hypothetical protein
MGLLFGLEHFELYENGSNLQNCLQKYQDMRFYVKFSKSSIFDSFEKMEIHLYIVFLKITKMFYQKIALTQLSNFAHSF